MSFVERFIRSVRVWSFLLLGATLGVSSAEAVQLNLTWSDNSTNEDGFYIERAPGSPTGVFAQIATTGANVQSYVDTSVMVGSTYCYRVRAHDAGGFSGYTNTACGATYALTVTKTGTGGGTVSSSPSGINCGNTCTASFSSGTKVTLAATAAAGSTFTGWSGSGCSGTGVCAVTLNAASTVTATFTGSSSTGYALTVTKTGTGSGTVSSSPSGINCGSTCTASFTSGTTVTLTATPAAGSTFTGWSGSGCSGTGVCAVTLNAASTVTATFTLSSSTTYALKITKTGTGGGTVSSSPSGINCGSTCMASFTSGTTVTLTATPAAGSTFTGWSGACTGTATCTVTMKSAQSVTAAFLSSLAAAYGFNEGKGTMTADASGNNNLGTLVGGVTWVTAGHSGNALSFNGKDGYVVVPDSARLDISSQGTVAAWVKLGRINTWRGVIAKGNVNKSAANNYFLELANDNTIKAGIGNGSKADVISSSVLLTDTTAYHHLAFTWTGSSLNLYLDGVSIKTQTQTITPIVNTAPVNLGQFSGNTSPFNGSIDEVRIYNRALSSSEIQTIMKTPVN